MAVSGGSAGGCLALIYAYRDADTSPIPVKCVIEAVGPASFEPALWTGTADDGSDEVAETAAAFCTMMSGRTVTADMYRSGAYRETMRGISPYMLVDENTVPTLCAYGTYDKIVPIALARSLVDALEKYDVAHDFIEFPRSGHGLQNDPKQAKRYFDQINRYLDAYLGGE